MRAVSSRSPIATRSGADYVSVDPSAKQTIDDLYNRGTIPFEVITERLKDLEATARRLWPVNTGRSRDAIALKLRESKGRLIASLVVNVWYAAFVYSKRLKKNAAQALILKPGDTLAEEWATRIAEEMAE